MNFSQKIIHVILLCLASRKGIFSVFLSLLERFYTLFTIKPLFFHIFGIVKLIEITRVFFAMSRCLVLVYCLLQMDS